MRLHSSGSTARLSAHLLTAHSEQISYVNTLKEIIAYDFTNLQRSASSRCRLLPSDPKQLLLLYSMNQLAGIYCAICSFHRTHQLKTRDKNCFKIHGNAIQN